MIFFNEIVRSGERRDVWFLRFVYFVFLWTFCWDMGWMLIWIVRKKKCVMILININGMIFCMKVFWVIVVVFFCYCSGCLCICWRCFLVWMWFLMKLMWNWLFNVRWELWVVTWVVRVKVFGKYMWIKCVRIMEFVWKCSKWVNFVSLSF